MDCYSKYNNDNNVIIIINYHFSYMRISHVCMRAALVMYKLKLLVDFYLFIFCF